MGSCLRWPMKGTADWAVLPLLKYYASACLIIPCSITSAEELVTACKSSLEKGQKAMFLPDLFTFGGRDNQILDSIHPDMKLLG